jgi:hypothetical protein
MIADSEGKTSIQITLMKKQSAVSQKPFHRKGRRGRKGERGLQRINSDDRGLGRQNLNIDNADEEAISCQPKTFSPQRTQRTQRRTGLTADKRG